MPATPTTTTWPTWTITCYDGRTIVQYWPPTELDRLNLCGPPPTTTMPPPPRITGVTATYGSGLTWLGGGTIATPESCPSSTTIRFTALIADGTSTSGSVGITAAEGSASARLPGGQTIRFTLYLVPGGGCIRGVMF